LREEALSGAESFDFVGRLLSHVPFGFPSVFQAFGKLGELVYISLFCFAPGIQSGTAGSSEFFFRKTSTRAKKEGLIPWGVHIMLFAWEALLRE